MNKKSLLLIGRDPFLTGIYGRKFERDGWDVQIQENIETAIIQIPKLRPIVILLIHEDENSCSRDVVKLRSLPTAQKIYIVLIAKSKDRECIAKSLQAGADAYLLSGHFVPQEAVEKVRELLQ